MWISTRSLRLIIVLSAFALSSSQILALEDAASKHCTSSGRTRMQYDWSSPDPNKILPNPTEATGQKRPYLRNFGCPVGRVGPPFGNYGSRDINGRFSEVGGSGGDGNTPGNSTPNRAALPRASGPSAGGGQSSGAGTGGSSTTGGLGSGSAGGALASGGSSNTGPPGEGGGLGSGSAGGGASGAGGRGGLVAGGAGGTSGPSTGGGQSSGSGGAGPPVFGPPENSQATSSAGEVDVGRPLDGRLPEEPASSPRRILETGYARLGSVGEETPGYGLYSYVLITSPSNKSLALLNEIFRVVPTVQNAGALPKNINILYVPFLKEKENDFAVAVRSNDTLGAKYAESFYNFQMARMILAHLCNPPADVLRQLCGGDLSRGPFIFTYEKPASTVEPVKAPYLFVDLRDVHERAFAEFVSAYQQQVKSEDVSSGERLNTLRLKFLNLTLNAADFVKPIPEALADAIRSAKP